MSRAKSDIIRSVIVLASNADEQIAYLERMGLEGENVDELALEFDDKVRMLPGLLEGKEVSADFASCASVLRDILSEMSLSGDYCWSVTALRNDARWQRVRDAACNCLTLIDYGDGALFNARLR